MDKLTKKDKLRFWSKVNIDRHNINACWEWQGGTQSKGYGSVSINGKTYNAHRIAWMLANGRLPLPDMEILHSCDNRKCCNPNHLSEGTHLENVQDMHRKGRANLSGLKHYAQRTLDPQTQQG